MTVATELPAPVANYLASFVRRARRLQLLRTAGLVGLAFIIWAAAWCVIDRYAALSPVARAAVLSVGIAAAIAVLLRAVIRASRRPNWVAAASAVERCNPRFSQKLVTVTSQSLAPLDQRGSSEILARLVEDVASGIRSTGRAQWPGLTATLLAWGALAAAAAMFAASITISPGHSRQLAGRFFNPFAGIAPVTTTQLRVWPGDEDVVQGQPLTIRVEAAHLGQNPVTLLLQSGRDWSSLPMNVGADAAYSFSLQSVDRDQKYYVTGGDAKSPEYSLRVLRRPAVSRFDLQQDFPAYTRLKPASAHNDDGHVEAPMGTRVGITITATEPLKQATFVSNGKRTKMTLIGNSTSARADFIADANFEYSIEMVSDRGVGSAMPAAAVRVLPDLPPQSRIVHGGDSLRLKPRDIVPVAFDALDDYGLVSLQLNIELNGLPAQVMSIALPNLTRRVQDSVDVDLARYSVRYGDTLTMTLVAVDTGGHETRSTPLQAMVAPQSVDIDAYERVTELQQAQRLASTLSAQISHAKELAGVPATQPSRIGVSGRFDREISEGIQSSAMLKRTLLRAVTHSDSVAFSVAMSCWIDKNEIVSGTLQETFRKRGLAPATQPVDVDPLQMARKIVDEQAKAIQQVADRERAATLNNDLENLAAAEASAGKDSAAGQRATIALDRMRQETSNEAKNLGLSQGPSLKSDLVPIIRRGDKWLQQYQPVQFGPAAAQWAKDVIDRAQRRSYLENRLASAAQAEAVRPDSDLVRARDLESAARAVASMRAKLSVEPQALAGAIRTVADRPRTGLGLHPTTMPTADVLALAAARSILRRATSDDENAPDGDLTAEGQKDVEALVIAANAAAASRQYKRAADLESQMYRRLRTRFRRDRASGAKSQPADDSTALPERIERRRQAADRETDAARRLDELDQRQHELIQSNATAAELARKQRGVADELVAIAGQNDASTPDGRDRATAEVLAGIEQLAAMPQQLADAQNAATAWRSTDARMREARLATTQAVAGDAEVYRRVVEGTQKSEREARRRLADTIVPLDPQPISQMAQRLGAYAPETDAARDMILVRLVPALTDVADALVHTDARDVDITSADALDSIFRAQSELAASRDLLVNRDPLAAARSFARMAADSLAASPPNIGSAKRHQAGVFDSLSRAWDQSIHRAAQQRLASAPSMMGVLGQGGADGDPTTRPSDRFSTARQWDRMRGDDDVGIDSGMHDSEPAGYEQSLKLYFEALGRRQGNR